MHVHILVATLQKLQNNLELKWDLVSTGMLKDHVGLKSDILGILGFTETHEDCITQ